MQKAIQRTTNGDQLFKINSKGYWFVFIDDGTTSIGEPFSLTVTC